MITTREEVLENALRVFGRMNYEKASQVEIAKACGMQSVANKFRFTTGSLLEFIDQYIAGVERTMSRLITLFDDGNNPAGCSLNFYYFHLLMQVRLYYPDVKKKIAAIFRQDYEIWTEAIQAAKKNGEIRQDLDEKDVAFGVVI